MNKYFLLTAPNRRVFHLAFHAKKQRTRKKNIKRLKRIELPQTPPVGNWPYGAMAGGFYLNSHYGGLAHRPETGLHFSLIT